MTQLRPIKRDAAVRPVTNYLLQHRSVRYTSLVSEAVFMHALDLGLKMNSNDSEATTSIGTANLVNATVEIMAAYVSNNSVPAGEIRNVIGNIHSALRSLSVEKAELVEKPAPRVPIKKSVTPDYLISLEDGGRYKSLKRHLTRRGMTPSQYKEKWGLPADYPMVAPNYAAKRSELAKSNGLGRKRAVDVPAEAESEVGTPAAKRGRPKKAPIAVD